MSLAMAAPAAAVLLALSAGSPPPGPGPKPNERIGVFLRCTGEEEPRKALAAVKSLGLGRIQVSRLPDRYYTPEGAREFAGLLKAAEIRSESVVVVFDGESYKDQESVVKTVGFRPVDLREARLDYARRCVDFAAAIGTKIVTLHMGVLPRGPEDAIYRGMLGAVGSDCAIASPRST